MQVAVGSANGYPAAWISANGGSTWTRASGQTQGVLDRPGIQQLTSVTYGPDGWLAVGGVIAVAAEHPVVLSSGNGSVWAAADREAAFSQPGLVTEQAAAGPATRLRHRRLPGRRRPHHRRGLVVGGPDRLAPRGRRGVGQRRPGRAGRRGAQPADAGRHRGPARVRRGRLGR